MREDYSADGDSWNYYPHDHARSRAYRWNEDGIAGFCDEKQHACLAIALWNEKDPIIKERMFGLSNPQGNHVSSNLPRLAAYTGWIVGVLLVLYVTVEVPCRA